MISIDLAFAIAVPLYIANSTPVLIKGKSAIDFKRNAWDHRRIFGDGKTWEGLVGGVCAGTLAGLVESLLFPPLMNFKLGFVLALGALLGDLVAAFFKRRLGLKRGDPAPILDQLDFVIGGLGIAWLLGYTFSLYAILIVMVATPFFHLLTNAIAYLLGLKSVPW
ncbi:MAG: CDP-2,3-bis-(O-geranylgeranyl)-sn-glycerol synthase [Thermoprotei archaeon]